LDRLDLDAASGDVRFTRVVEVLAADANLDCGALLAAGGVDVSGVRGLLGEECEAITHRRDAEAQRKRGERLKIKT
jgi:hypothetical protein